jgi:hypothetical protein
MNPITKPNPVYSHCIRATIQETVEKKRKRMRINEISMELKKMLNEYCWESHISYMYLSVPYSGVSRHDFTTFFKTLY